ncbi:MAG TPA: TRCF domain-containing protein, partial [Vicinamibacterales bacterium]|nr:TRCF domain-containing protein [Vicinamibacterales bacterium]
VGFDMYMKLLEQTIRELKGEELEDERRASVNLKLDLRLDDQYIPDMNQRLAAYRRLANARDLEGVTQIVAELRDRYGEPPPGVRNLAEYARIRLMADRVGLDSLDREGQVVVLKFRQDAKLDPAWLYKFVAARGDLTLLPPAVLRLDLGRPTAPTPKTTLRKSDEEGASWWTARATAAVEPGFRREVILAETAPDPGATGGLFERLGELLGRLSEAIVAS